MEFIYNDIMKRVHFEKMPKFQRIELIEYLEQYASQYELYEDLNKLKSLREDFVRIKSKKTKK
jgi:hypothetical protein